MSDTKAIEEAVSILRTADRLRRRWNSGEFHKPRSEWGRNDAQHWYHASPEYKALWLLVHRGIIEDWKIIRMANSEAMVIINWNDNEVGAVGKMIQG
jgi:hypothetical protein